MRQRQQQHGAYRQRAALGGVEGGRAEERRGVGLAPGDDALGGVELARAVDLGDVQRLDAQRPRALVPGHVQPHGMLRGVGADEIADGGWVHGSPFIRRMIAGIHGASRHGCRDSSGISAGSLTSTTFALAGTST